MRKTLRAAGATALATGLLLAGAGSAAAHVTISPDTTTAGAYALLTIGVPHGCGDSATTRVSIQIPEQLASVTPSINPGWEVEKVMEDLAEPLDDGHGGQRTERVAEVVYTTDTPLPDGYRDAFVLSVKLPDLPGETLVFPAVQECEEGESAWVQVPQDGQDPHELELPAPSFEITTAGDAGEATAVTASDETTAGGDQSAVPLTAAAEAPATTWVALALGAGGLLLGGLALLRTRRTQS